MDAAGPAYRGYAGPGRRRGRLRWVFLGLGAAILTVGVVLILVSLYPRAFGLRPALGFPFGGGFLGLFLTLWGTLLLVRLALWTSHFRRFGAGGPPGRRFDPALMTARQRYARGEIDREQFEQIVRDLRRPPGTSP